MGQSQSSVESEWRRRAEGWYLELVSGRRRGLFAAFLRGALSVGSALYRFGLLLHRLYYRLPWMTYRMGVCIVSVGNLTVGGTGKTPMTALIVRRLLALGRRPGIASRGYMAADDGINEELALLADELGSVPHVQNPSRIFAIQQLTKDHGCDVVILDDGFQHWPLARDLDVVLIDALQPFGYGHLLPRGLLREPPRSLRRADIVALTRADQVGPDELEHLKARVEKLCRPGTPILVTKHEAVGLRRLDGGVEQVSNLRGKRIVAACGIGNAEAFRRTLADLGPEVALFTSFGDHHHYAGDEIENLFALAEQHGANMVVTTTKDLVKWKSLLGPQGAAEGPRVLAVEVRIRLLEGGLHLDESLAGLFGAE